MASKKQRQSRSTKSAPKKGKANRTTRDDWAPAFLRSLARYGNITKACADVKIDRGTFYARRDSDQGFAGLAAEALEVSTDLLELEARRRGEDGVDRPVFGSGGTGVGTVEVGKIREYSDTLLIFLLKAHRPEKYRERHEVKHAGSVNVTTSAETMTDDELATIARDAISSTHPGDSR